MTLSPFHRRILLLAGALLIVGIAVRFWPEDSAPVAADAGETVAIDEQRLARLRDVAASVPAKEEILKKAQSELAGREKGLLIADTAAQAQAQLIQIVRQLGSAETPPVDIRTEGFGLRALGDVYGEASVSVQLECRIDQLVNMLAALAARPELVSTNDLRVIPTNSKEKTVSVRLTVSGVVPRKLVPERHS